MVFSILSWVVRLLWEFLKIPLCLFTAFLLYCIIAVSLRIFAAYKKGFRFRKGSRVRLKLRRWWQKLFIDFPERYSADLMEREPDFFRYQGLYMFTGRQGRGKTIAMAEFIRRMQQEYPLARCLTNFGYTKQDGELIHWKQLVNYKNGRKGVIIGMDETQNWFSSNQSKDFPPEMLEVVTQNRKNRRVIAGTAQNFYLLAKNIRTQTVEVRDCLTLFGCVTIVRCREPYLNDIGEVVKWKRRGMYWFVHDRDLRESYDTYRVVESLAKSGFQPGRQTEPVVVNANFTVNRDSK